MQNLLKQLEDKIQNLNELSESDKQELFNLIKKINKKAEKLNFKLISVINRDKETKKIMSSMIQEIEAKKNIIKEIHEELLASEEELRQNFEELQTANEHLQAANDLIREKNKIIEQSHKSITDSINYAQTIQKSLLTKNEKIASFFDEFFIWFNPKDQVGGDFYYFNKIDDEITIAIADCTGHGVPGGFMSILSITFLHEIIRRKETDTPGETLNLLRQRIKEIFSASGSHNNNGLDIALCAVNTKNNSLQFAGAYSPLIIIRNDQLIEYKATRNPIGNYPKEVNFANTNIKLEKNDVIYMFSDGFQDQFGDEPKKKFQYKNFKKLLLNIHKLPMHEQKQKLIATYENWKGDLPQTDDILIFGMKY